MTLENVVLKRIIQISNKLLVEENIFIPGLNVYSTLKQKLMCSTVFHAFSMFRQLIIALEEQHSFCSPSMCLPCKEAPPTV